MKSISKDLWLFTSIVLMIANRVNGLVNPCLGNTGVADVPDPLDCTRFYTCVDDQNFPQQCSPGLIFDMITSSCNRVDVSICVKDIPTPPVPEGTDGTTVGPPTAPVDDGETTPPGDNAPTAGTPAPTVIIPTAPTDVLPPATTTVIPQETTLSPTGAPSAPTPEPTAAPTAGTPQTTLAPTPDPTLGPTPAPSAPTPTIAPTPAPSAPTPAPTLPPATTVAPTVPPPPPTTVAPPPPAPTTTAPPSTDGAPHCPLNQVFYAPHPDCTRFFRCVFGTLFVLDCPRNQHWNQAREYCDHIWNVQCPSVG